MNSARRSEPASAISGDWDVLSFPGRVEIEAALRALPEGPETSCAGMARWIYIQSVVDEALPPGPLASARRRRRKRRPPMIGHARPRR